MAKTVDLKGSFIRIVDDGEDVAIKHLPVADTIVTIDKVTLDLHFHCGNQKITVQNEDLPGITNLAQALAFVDALADASLPKTGNGALLVGTAEDRFYSQFFDFDTDNDWELLHATTLAGLTPFNAGAHPAMPVTGPLGGAAAGSTPYVNIAAGTTGNIATLLLARPIVKAPVEARIGITMSQRLTQNNVLVGFFECDPVTGELLRGNQYRDEQALLNIRNLVAFLLDGATATQANMAYRASESGAVVVGATTFSGFTTVAGGTGPNFTSGDELIINFERDRLTFRSLDNNSVSFNSSPTISRNDAIPNHNRAYRFGVIVLNNGTPASNTDVRLHYVNVLNSARLDISPRFTANDVAKSLPVQVLGTLPGVAGTAAHDAAVTGNPLLLGAEARTANPTAVSAQADVARLLATMIGVLVTKPHAINEASWNFTGQLTTTSDVAIQAAATGLRRHIVGGIATNTGAAAVSLLLRDGTTTRLTITIPAGQSVVLNLEDMFVQTQNTALNAQLSAAGTVQLAMWGYTAP